MKSQQATMKCNNTIIAIILGAVLMAAGLASANAESWELRTAAEEVKGTRDIKEGRIDKGIRILETHYGSTAFEKKGAVLTNLCLAYTVKRDYETAMVYCDRAVARHSSGREAYNNRGVLHAILGNYAAAISDFEKAGCLRECPSNLAVAGNRRMDVAKRNLGRAQVQLAHQEKINRESQVADRVDP